jgi:hypothetical protein
VPDFFSGSQTDPGFQNKNSGCRLTGRVCSGYLGYDVLFSEEYNNKQGRWADFIYLLHEKHWRGRNVFFRLLHEKQTDEIIF